LACGCCSCQRESCPRVAVDGEVFHAEGALQVDQCCGSDEFYPKKKSVSRRKPKILKKVK
jgi:hypothetical protein